MTIPFSQVNPASLKMKVLPRYPAAYRAGPGVAVEQEAGVVTTSIDFSNLVFDTTNPVTGLYIAAWNDVDKTFRLYTSAALIGPQGTPGPANASDYETRALAAAATIAAPVQYLRTAGYYAAGDYGGALYKRASSIPTGSNGFQSVDGAFWELHAKDPSVHMFGAKGDGATDDTAAIQSCATYVGYAGSFHFEVGTYIVSSTISLRGASRMYGRGVNATIIYRTGDYGDTFVIGSVSAEPARACHISHMWLLHSVAYTAGDAALANKATHGAHIRVKGAQFATITDVWADRLPYGFYFEGGSWVTINNCMWNGVYDSSTAALQEGIANLVADVSAANPPSNPTTWVVTNNRFGGAKLNRDITYTSTTGNVVKTNVFDTIGPLYNFQIFGMEDLYMAGNYFGGASDSQVVVFNKTDGGFGACIDWRIIGNFFDGISRGQNILFAPTQANLFCYNVTIANNEFISSLHGVFINQNTGSGTASVQTLKITSNTFRDSIGCPLLINGASGFIVSDNIFQGYNTYNISPSDLNYCAAAIVNGVAANGKVSGNSVLGGAHCYNGLYIDALVASTIVQTDNLNMGGVTNWYAQTPFAPIGLKTYAKAALPPVAISLGHLIMVSDDVGGQTPAFCDGVNWRRVADRAVIS